MSENVLFPSNVQLASYLKPSSRTERIFILGLKRPRSKFSLCGYIFAVGRALTCREQELDCCQSSPQGLRTYGEGLGLQGLLESKGDSLLSGDLSSNSFFLENRIDMSRWGQWQPGAQGSAICPLNLQYNLPLLWHPAAFFQEETPLSSPRRPKEAQEDDLSLFLEEEKSRKLMWRKKGSKSFPCFPFYLRHIHNLIQKSFCEIIQTPLSHPDHWRRLELSDYCLFLSIPHSSLLLP